MNKEDILKPFKPGESGNPKGRKKGSLNLKTILENLLSQETDEIDEISGKRLNRYQKATLEVLKKAMAGDIYAFRELADRFEGKPSQSIEVKEKTIDDLETMSDTELKERGEAIWKKLNDKTDPGT